MRSPIADCRKILVITKFGYLGDTIVATPFLKRLREAAPRSHITLLSGPAIPELLQGCPYVNHIEPFDRKAQGIFAAAKRLREARFDAVFLLNRSLHSGLLAALARIPIRVGHDTEMRGFSLTVRVPYEWSKPDRECAVDLLKAVGADAEPAMPELWVTAAEKTAAQGRLADAGIDAATVLIGMQPGANDPFVREWGAERFAEVADRLSDLPDVKIALFGGPQEAATSQRLVSVMKGSPVVFTGTTGLREALALISMCRLWIGNDAGLLHAAVALGVPTVGIFGPTKAPRWGYEDPWHWTITANPEGSARDSQTIRQSLDSIAPDTVYQAARALLQAAHAEV